MPLPSSWVVVVVRHYHYSTHQNQLGSCMSVSSSERIELSLNTHPQACSHKQNIYDEKLNWNKSSTWASNSLELRISCAQLKTTRIHGSSVQTNAGVWSNLIFNLESKAKVITCGRIRTGSYSGGGEQKFPLKHQSPKISQISPVTQWHIHAHFWYSKVDLDWVRICSKNCIFRGNTALKTAEQRLTKLSITLCRKYLKSWKVHSGCST
jgi:hypothetical protein